MVAAVSVVVLASGTDGPLDDLVESLDRQTLPCPAFELVVDEGSGPASARLAQLAGRRPNIRLVGAGHEVGSWQEAATGEHLLILQPGDVLFPEALERMTGYAGDHALHVLAARVVRPGAVPEPFLLTDRALVDPAEVDAVLPHAALLVRRKAVGPDGLVRPAEGLIVGVLASYPALRRSAEQPVAPAATLQQRSGLAAWSGTVLEISAAGVPGTVEGDPAELSWSAVVRDTATELSFLLPCRVAASATGWEATVQLDPTTGAAGRPLPEGVWEVELGAWGAAGSVGPFLLQVEPPTAAILDGLLVVPGTTDDGVLQLDLGATRGSLVAGMGPEDLTVVESAAGSLGTLRLPDVVVAGSCSLPGRVALGSLRLPAVLRADSDGARVEVHLSGLAGSSRLATQFGSGPMQPTGLDLVIAGNGSMSAVRTPPAAPKAAKPTPKAAKPTPKAAKPTPKAAKPTPKATKPTQSAAATKPGSRPKPAPRKQVASPPAPLTRVQHLRRAVPAPAAPLVDAVARWPLARRLYRRAAGLSRPR